MCGHCKAMVSEPASVICPICRNQLDYRTFSAVEPLGFCTDFQPRDYDGQIEWAPRSTYSRVASDERDLRFEFHQNYIIGTSETGKAELISVNDNNGGLFQFVPTSQGQLMLAGTSGVVGVGTQQSLALVSRKVTDILLVGVWRLPHGIDLTPTGGSGSSGIYGRAALYSFGFLLRRSVASKLDIDEREISVGMRPFRDENGIVNGQVFLSDTLENGAGYCRRLAEPGELETALRYMLSKEFSDPLVDKNHASVCQSACYDCMQDYSNMAFHSLLDWRLGLDIANLALSKEFVPKIQGTHWSQLASTGLEALGKCLNSSQRWSTVSLPNGLGNILASKNHDQCIVPTHPLWNVQSRIGPELADIWAEAEDYGSPIPANVFDLIRRPAAVMVSVR